MTVQARYSGTCPECGERWQPGDLIRADEPPLGSLPEWQHATCPDNPTDPSLKAGETVCDQCWLVHPEGKCDR